MWVPGTAWPQSRRPCGGGLDCGLVVPQQFRGPWGTWAAAPTEFSFNGARPERSCSPLGNRSGGYLARPRDRLSGVLGVRLLAPINVVFVGKCWMRWGLEGHLGCRCSLGGAPPAPALRSMISARLVGGTTPQSAGGRTVAFDGIRPKQRAHRGNATSAQAPGLGAPRM